MIYLILALLALWLILAIVGVVIKGLFWLTVIAAILFLVTAVWARFQSRSRT
ncbi:hypothetical protein [Nocardiopsis lambiniae]|uniref:Hydrophobic protein n=1 Tax=Nocardiopsis lambiniae TaxID=3075539 RepID=A0ABU2M3I2_9ACTN|nr:hypothetical protein [Nocardiopsis sp. DSM 44743]MDT0327162.1 hypothetical protein [Nocardiopsis sp. DSM 44743]